MRKRRSLLELKCRQLTRKSIMIYKRGMVLNKLIWYNILTNMNNGGERCGKE